MVSTSPSKKRNKSLSLKKKNVSPRSIVSETSISSVEKSRTSKTKTTKKVWSFECLVGTMTPTEEELKFRESKAKGTSAQKYSKSFRCTNCNKTLHTDSDIDKKVETHPCLGVLMCKDCCDYYRNGEFSLDSEGEDKYCRWCGEGGTIFGCSKCICGFCLRCIKKHFGIKYLRKVERDDDWECFFCNPKPLWEERYICFLAKEMSENKASKSTPSSSSKTSVKGSEKEKESSKKLTNSGKKKIPESNSQDFFDSDTTSSVDMLTIKFLNKSENDTKRKVYTSSDEEELKSTPLKSKRKKLKSSNKEPQPQKPDKSSKASKSSETPQEESFENLKTSVLEKLERILKLSEYQLAFGVKWSSKISTKLADCKQTTSLETLKDECGKIKWFFSVLSTYLVEFCNSVDSIEKLLEKESGAKDCSNISQLPTDPNGFSTVLQFLSFITNQVKTFTEKGLCLTDVLNAEIYDDSKVIGIRKSSKSAGSCSNESPGNKSQGSSCNSEKNSENAERSSEAKGDEDESKDEDSLRLRIDQGSEPQDGDEDLTEVNSSETTSGEKKSKSSNRKTEILEILEILEHA